jgi:hypothetical protein
MSTHEIEKRLTAVEQEIAHLKVQRPTMGQPHPIQSLERIHGTFEDDDAFQEAARLGRKWRDAQRIVPGKPKAKRK